MIGLRLEIPNEYGKFLYDIINIFSPKGDRWFIQEDEVYLENGEELFKENEYANQEFLKIISKDPNYLIFGKFMLDYGENINNSDNFKTSSCKIYINIVDSVFVDVYFKEKKLLINLEEKIKRKNFKILKKTYNKFFEEE